MIAPARRTLVVDASAIGAILFAEAEAASVADAISGCRLTAPALITTELTSIALKKVRREAMDAEDIAVALTEFANLRVAVVATASGGLLGSALASRLSAYDASYLMLAEELGVPLVTLDRDLKRASLEAGLEVLS